MESVPLLHKSSGVQRERPRHLRSSFRLTQRFIWQNWCFRVVAHKTNKRRIWQKYFEGKFSYSLFTDYLWNEWKLIKYLKHWSYFDFNLLFDDSEDILASEWHQAAVMNLSYYIETAWQCWFKVSVNKFCHIIYH